MWARIIVIAFILAVPGVALAQDGDSFRQLLIRYHCQIVDRLQRIYAHGDPAVDHDEYLIVDIPARPEAYVQCIFHAMTKIMCEAASGFYLNAPGEPRTYHLPAAGVAALGRLGFSTDDSKGNFRIDLDLTEPPDFNALAEFILRALHDAYGAQADTELLLVAPYAPHDTFKCHAVS